MVHPSREQIREGQAAALRALAELLPHNAFYRARLGSGPLPGPDPAAFTAGCPFTLKADLVADQTAHPPFGSNHCYPREAYTRFHQTSGSTGLPIRWLDTPEDWQGLVDNWALILRTIGLTPADRCFFAFSFGPFLGFWTAFEAGTQLGCLCIPGGGMRTSARLRTLLDSEVTALFCTPTYAVHMGQAAAAESLDLSRSRVRAVIVAGEPGGSLPETRALIERLWPGARVYDHHGMTEVGPVSLPCPHHRDRLHIMEHAYLPEILEPGGDQPVPRGQAGELVLTTLGRKGSPLLRYRTGDLVRAPEEPVCACGRADLSLAGGILGRIDDMVVVRGVNLYPSAIDELVRTHDDVVEYRVDVALGDGLSNITVQAEFSGDHTVAADRLARALSDALQLRVDVVPVPADSLPRFELKAKRWHVRRT